ncbi:MAG: TonB-dependent receptor [Balneolaceae bacterium]
MPKSFLVLLLAIFGLLSSVNIYAQPGNASVSGYITDFETGETLIGANIALIEINKGSSSNTLGYYSIPNIKADTYTLVCSFIGYKTFKRTITLSENESLRLEVSLSPEGLALEEIVVESQREKREQKNIGTVQMNTALIKELPSVFQADVFRSIQLLPGVKASSDFSSGLYIRGGGPDQTLILLDRTTVYNPSHFFGLFSTFNPDAIKNVRLYKGGYPAEYGGRLGSVLDIYNKDGNRKEVAGTVSLGMLSSRVMLEGPYKKGSWSIAARRSTLEPILNVLNKFDDLTLPSNFYFLDINGKINYDAGPNDKLNLSFYSGVDVLKFPLAEDFDIKLNYGNQTVSSNWTHIFNERLFSNFVFTGARYFNFPSFNLAGTKSTRDNNIYDFTIKSDLEYLATDSHTFKGGFWGGVMTLKLNDSFDGANTFGSRTQANYGSAYLQDTWKATDRLEFIGGLRVSYFSDGNYVRAEPRLSAEFSPNNRLRFQAAAGRYTQYLTLQTNEAFTAFDVWLTADEGVRPSYGDQFVLGVKTIPFEDYGFDVEVYYRTMKDLFETDPFIPDISGLPYKDTFRFGSGDAYGIEMLFEKRVGRLTGFIGYTFAYTWRKFPGYNNEIGNPNGPGRSYPPKYDRKNDVMVVLDYRLSKKWKFTTAYNYATGQAYTEPLGRYNLQNPTWDNPNFVTYQTFVTGKVNASRLPAYTRLDVSFTRKSSFFKLADAEWQFQIVNVMNRRNVWFYNYDFESNPVKKEEVKLLPILPTISYTVNF